MRRRHRLLVAAGLLAPACSPAPTATRGTHSSATPPAEAGPDTTAAATATSAGPTSSADAGGRDPTSADLTTTAYVITVPTDPPTTTTVRPRPLPTTTLPEAADEAVTDAEWWEAQQGYVVPTTGRTALLACIRSYEGGYGTNTGNGYYGAYQFDLQTWRSVGGTGLPSDAEPGEQDMRAGMLLDRRGLAPWPTPARRC